VKSKLFIFITAILCLILLASHGKPNQSINVEELLDLGEKYLLEMEYEQAVIQFLKVIEIEPMNPRGYTGAAEAYIALGQLDNALSVLQEGSKALPNNIEIQTMLDEVKAMLNEIQTKADEFLKELDSEENENLKEDIKNDKSKIAYSWYLEPTIEADNIDLLLENSSTYTHASHCVDYISVIERNGLKGLITYEGAIIVNTEYNNIYLGYGDGEYNLLKETGNDTFVSPYKKILTADNNVLPNGEIEGGTYATFAYYNTDTNEILTQNWNGELVKSTVKGLFGVLTINNSIISQANNLSSWEINSLCSENNPYYCIVYYDKKITDTLYSAVATTDTGILVSDKTDKWGYYNETGNLILDCVYDGAWEIQNDYYVPYTPSEGYLVICKNGDLSLITENGDTVIPFGEYEELRPVYENKLWAKHNGKWGVLLLDEDNAVSNINNAYNDFLENAFKSSSTPTHYIYIDMNSDGIDELLVFKFNEYNQAHWRIFAYSGGVVEEIGSGDYEYNASTKAMLVDNCIYVDWERASVNYYGGGEEYYIMVDGTIKCYSYSSFFEFEVINGESVETYSNEKYQCDNKEISKNEFLSITNKYNSEKGILIEPAIMQKY